MIEGTDTRPNGQSESDYPSVYNRIERPTLEQNQQVDSITKIAPDSRKEVGCETFGTHNGFGDADKPGLETNNSVASERSGGARAPDAIDTSNDPAKRGKVEPTPETKFNSEDNIKRGKIESSTNTESSPESESKRGRVTNTDVDPNTFKVANDTSNSAASSSTGMSTNSIT